MRPTISDVLLVEIYPLNSWTLLHARRTDGYDGVRQWAVSLSVFAVDGVGEGGWRLREKPEKRAKMKFICSWARLPSTLPIVSGLGFGPLKDVVLVAWSIVRVWG